jgi:hypothetical protein
MELTQTVRVHVQCTMYMHMTNNIRGVFMRICGLQNVGWSLQLIHIYVYNLKGLSYEIDFENVDEN